MDYYYEKGNKKSINKNVLYFLKGDNYVSIHQYEDGKNILEVELKDGQVFEPYNLNLKEVKFSEF
jgi:hypothetical protein